jgi:hypothetical protein
MDMNIKRIGQAVAKRMGKKAVLFSLIAVLFSVLFITMFSQSFSTTLEDRIPSSNIRIRVLDIYVRNFESYAENSIKISTYRTLESITRDRQNKGFFADFQEFNRTFHDCMTCGKFECSNPASGQCDLGEPGYDLNSSIKKIADLSLNQLNINTEYAINSINIYQDYPFEVEVLVNISYNVTDNAGGYYARWTKNKVINQTVAIIGLTDPLGFIGSTGKYTKYIKRYTGKCEFDASCWDYTTTKAFYQAQEFRYYPNGTGFLQRYWNDPSPSECCGIEHIMNGTSLPGPDTRNSYIDRYYWSGRYTCRGFGDPKILRILFDGEAVSLDESTASRYNVASSGTVICPT